jgi:hypothetical protein
MIKNVCWSSREAPVIPVVLQRNLSVIDGFSKNAQISNFMRIHPVWAALFRADRQTDISEKKKPVVAFRNFAKGPKNG